MKSFWKAALNRAFRTLCQTAVAMLGTCVLLEEVDWWRVCSASLLAAVLSLLSSAAMGLPEVEE